MKEEIKYLKSHKPETKPLTTIKKVENTEKGIKVTMETTPDFTLDDYVIGMINIMKALSE